MNEQQFFINCLFWVIGILCGIGIAHLTLLKKVNQIKVSLAQNDKDIEYTRSETKRINEQVAAQTSLHQEALGLMTKIVDQNNLLIQKVTVSK